VIRRFTLLRWIEAYATWREYEEAKRALANVCHHMNCGSGLVLGTDAMAHEPESCFQGDETQGPCLRIYQHNRIRFLHEKSLKLLGAKPAKRRRA